jgi:hypothetical protein
MIASADLAAGAANYVVLDALLTSAAAPRRRALAKAIEDTARAYPRCRCQLSATMTDAELIQLGAGCTDPQWACARLVAVRRRVVS